MSAPTVQYIASTQALGTLTLPPGTVTNATVAIGDLCVISRIGTPANATTNLPTYHDDGTDAGYTQDVSLLNTGNERAVICRKVLVAGDFSGSNLRTLDTGAANTGSGRAQIWIFRHPNGIANAACLVATYTSITSVTDAATIFNFSDVARPQVLIAVWAVNTGQATLQASWDGGTARDPYCDDSTGTTTTGGHTNHYGGGAAATAYQADYNEYDVSGTPSTLAWSKGQANANHAIAVAQYQFSAQILTASITDGAVASDAVTTRTFTGTRATTNGAVAGDAITRTAAEPRTSTDGAVASDAITARAAEPRTIADGTVAHDSLGAASFTRALTDGAVASEIVGFTKSRAITDGTVASDAITQHVVAYLRALTDGAVANSSVAISQVVHQALADGTVASDFVVAELVTAITFAISDPGTTGPFGSATLNAWARKLKPTDIGDISLALLQGNTILQQSDWFALGDTIAEYQLNITATVTDFTILRVELFIRSASSCTAEVSQTEVVWLAGARFADGTVAADSITVRHYAGVPSITDGVVASDSTARTLVGVRTLTDGTVATDTVVATRTSASARNGYWQHRRATTRWHARPAVNRWRPAATRGP